MPEPTCERCGDECSEMLGGLCCDCVRDRCDKHHDPGFHWGESDG